MPAKASELNTFVVVLLRCDAKVSELILSLFTARSIQYTGVMPPLESMRSQ